MEFVIAQAGPTFDWAARLYYASFIFTGLAIGIVTSLVVKRKYNLAASLTTGQRAGVALSGLVGAMVGAKLPFMLLDLDGMVSGSAWWADGKTIVWGLMGGYIGVEVGKWSLGVKERTGDTFALPLALAIAFGRLGCFFAGCCYGTATSLPWAVRFHDDIARHPTQLYEVFFHLTMAAVMLLFIHKQWLKGSVIRLYFFTYFLFRFFTEFIRPEEKIYMGGLSFYQWSSLAFAGVMLALLLPDIFKNWKASTTNEATEPAVGSATASA